ncbi:hypothetical protein OQ477_17605 [Bacillus sp. ChL18]|uniref:hypothetical protein n=1 Tax=Bacillus TaxID=1386 RepID=UPI002248DBFB|nr:hypothetical protein [Bacillus sp. ChL18]MCX2811781.1 hypothetical protein [Bacillus sp. ChL18]
MKRLTQTSRSLLTPLSAMSRRFRHSAWCYVFNARSITLRRKQNASSQTIVIQSGSIGLFFIR